MIECKHGEKCKFKGHPADLVAEYVEITEGFNELLEKNVGSDAAKEIIVLCGKAAFSETREKRQSYGEEIATILAQNISNSH